MFVVFVDFLSNEMSRRNWNVKQPSLPFLEKIYGWSFSLKYTDHLNISI